MPSTSYSDAYSLKFPHHHAAKPTPYSSDSQLFDIVADLHPHSWWAVPLHRLGANGETY